MSISYTYRPFDWWNIHPSLNLYYSKSKSDKSELKIPNVEGFGGSLSLRSTFLLNKRKTTMWQIVYYHILPSQHGLISINDFEFFSSNFRFIALKGKLNFIISAFDIFHQNIIISERQYNSYKSKSLSDDKLQNFRISVTYSFGNKKVHNQYKKIKNTERRRAK